MENAKYALVAMLLLCLAMEVADGQTCTAMWDPIFESNPVNPPTMCAVSTTSGSQCVFPFNYGGVTYKTCTIQGPNNGASQPQCATTVNSNNTAVTWSFCVVPSDAMVTYATVRKNGYVTQDGGSTQGGTLLWIYGQRFAPIGFTSSPSVANANTVQLVDGFAVYSCEMQNDKCTATQLTCYAPMLPESVYQIRVYVNGFLIPLYQYQNPAQALFIPMLSQTPLITGISPQSGTPQSLIQLAGSFETACYSRDIDGCSQDNNPLISRIYVGGHLCNLIDPLTGLTYGNVTSSLLQCNFEGTEVGIFNISMLISNEYGRALVSPYLYRITGSEDLYTFQSYGVVNSVTPNTGSTAGGTTLTINGNFFSDSPTYPLVVQVGGQPCTILSSNGTAIQCQTSVAPSSILNQYQGGRGLQVFHASGSNTQASLSGVSPPTPPGNAAQSWTDDASIVSNATSAETAWLIGYVRVPKAATYVFTVNTNGVAALFLSTNDDPANKVRIADATTSQSASISLQNNTNYYLFCVGSRSSGGLQLSVQARMLQTTLTAGVSSLVQNEIQRIDVTASVASEQQQIAYTTTSTNGTSEVQSLLVDISTFQIGFRGVYTGIQTGRPTAAAIQAALNDLPTIYPSSVSVSATSTLYLITFPTEMGNVPSLTCISSSPNQPNITELTPGLASGAMVAFDLDNQLTDYIDFVNTNVTQAELTSLVNNLFSIQCPPSINNPTASSDIVLVQDYETNCVFDDTPIRTNAFCGQCASNGNTLVSGNTQVGNVICFAYRVTNNYVISITLGVQVNEIQTTIWTQIPFTAKADQAWHYLCVDIQAALISQSTIDPTSYSLIIQYASLNNNIKNGIFIDAVTVRTAFPLGYEAISSYPVDQSANSSCVFPFNYNGQTYSACTLDNNNIPICADSSNRTLQCQSSSIEGVRRLYPKHQLVYNTLQVTYTPSTPSIAVAFRYSDCSAPALFTSWPSTSATITRTTAASPAASGTFDLVFGGQTYASIPVNIATADLAVRLQSSPQFGFLNIQRSRDCTGYSYTIEWIANGGAKTPITITNAGSVTPAGTTVSASSVQPGGVVFKPLSGDITRTYQTNPQVEVFVGGFPSQCASPGVCDFQWLLAQTPSITSVSQSGTTLTIAGTGFSTTPSANTVIIGGSGSCTVTAATAISLTCTIAAAPAGTYPVQVNVVGKGLATAASSFTATVALQVTSISPSQGGAGGGYLLTIVGSGFSSSSTVTVDNNVCANPAVSNFASITCTVPASNAVINTAVTVAVNSGSSTAQASTQFTYNVANTPTIAFANPSVVPVSGGELNITGTNFGTDSITVSIGTTQATVEFSSATQILATLPSLAPGIYPISVMTVNGQARPALSIEYRFYVQSVSPQVGSLYGGSDVYVQGQGFDSSDTVSFTDGSNTVPCPVVSSQSNQIHCQTAPAAPQVVISSNGVDPTYGIGFAWTPQYATVQQGAVVQWQWGGSDLLASLSYKVQEIASSASSTPVAGGFDSGNGSASGSFSYQFQTVGTHYYWSPAVDPSGLVSMRGMITVVAAQPLTLTVNVASGSFAAQSCAFPFVFNSNSYSACTTVNDTQSWCSPTAVYTGQRLYCTATASVPAPSCGSSSLINPSSCASQTVPSNVLQFLFTPCTVGTVTSISPVRGPSGTSITITGTGFSTTTCVNNVLIGSSYQCPIQTATATQIVCQIGANSLLSARTVQNVQVNQVLRGSLSNDGLFQFQFQAQITSVAPQQGSTAGGTIVVINGDGFTPADTRVFIGSIEYTSTAIITYSSISIVTGVPPASYIGQVIPITILVGTNAALCSSGTCTFTWAQSATPSLNSVSPSSITGPQTLTLTGQNFAAAGSITAANVHVSIDGQVCNVTSATNTTITCQTGSLPVGNYSIVVSIDGVGSVVSSPILTSSAAISSISPTSGGVNGGVLLTINGNGFASSASDIQVSIGSSACPIVQTSPGQVQCTVPAQGSNPSSAPLHVVSHGVVFPSPPSFTYSSGATPAITSVSPTTGVSGQTLAIAGSNFVTAQTSVTVGGTICAIVSVSASSITCTVGAGPAGNQPVVVSVATVGTSNANVQFRYNLVVTSASPAQGSFGGGQTVTIAGDGLNSPSATVTICGQACQSITAVSNTQLTCVTPSATPSSSNQACTLTVSVGGLSQSAAFTYQSSLTANVASVSPLRGGTGGGTLLTINGTNFPTANSAVTVSIAGVPCTVQSTSATTITCATGAFSGTTVQATVLVNLVNGGNAIGSAQFQYIDLWSSPWTWGGNSPPEAGTIVSIDSGKTVYFDTTTPILKALVIDNATLIFDDNQDVAFNAEYILVVNGGILQVGTESNPFQHQAVITMYGHLRSIELPIFGAKVLALRGGTVDMHGRSVVRTWTRLASTAATGASQITLLENVDWPVGSLIVIATTGDYLSQGETETRTVTGVSANGLVLTLDSPLTFSHLGVTQLVGSTSVEARAEVGLLSHNILFQGSTDSTWNTTIQACPTGFDPGEFAVQTCFLGRYGQEMGSDQFGATIMVSGSMDNGNTSQAVILRLSNIEVYNGGQAFRLGRYPVHFHMNGNMSSSYIKSSSIHQTFNRAVNIHASHFVTVQNNVIHDIMGGAMFLEDGVEVGNVLSGNLAVFVRTSSSLLNEDVTPAAFWVTNPNNIVENNAVAGGTHFGYWYRMLATPDGPSFANFPNFCPFRQQMGRFTNNTVHSTGRFGVWIFPEYSPTVAGSCWGDSPYQAVFDGLIAWRNQKGLEWVMSSSIQVRNALVFDNANSGLRCVTAINNQDTNLPNLRATFYNENTGPSVINSIVIGDSGLPGGPVVPEEGGLVVMWDRGLRVRNVSFINFPSQYTQAIFGPFITGRCVVFCGGWMTKFAQLSFTNVLNRGHFRWAYDGLYVDEDGTLANAPGSIILPPDGLWNGSSDCTVTPNFVNAITCPASLGTWIRFAFNGANLGQNGQELNIYDTSNHHTVVPNLHKRLTHPNGYMMNLLTRRTYLFQFQNANSSVNLSYTGVAYNLAAGDYLIINHQVSYMPDLVYTTSSAQLATASPGPLSASNNNGDWYYDNSTSIFSYIVKNPSSGAGTVDVSIPLNVIKCRYPNCQFPPQPGLELPAVARPATALFWSNDSHWSFTTNGFITNATRKPLDNTDVYIPRGIWMVIDYPLPPVNALRIDGVLEFEQGMNNTLAAQSILINGGQLIAGWPNNPLTSNVDIVITGSSSVDVLFPNGAAGSVGPRVLAVLGGLDLHGIPHNVSWTRLGATAAAGQNTITLSEPVDWTIGSEIIVTTTDTRVDHVERHTIASVNIARTGITLVNPLAYTHVLIQNTFPNGQVFHVAGAVGLLTRNVRVINRSPASELFGFRVLVTDYAVNIQDPVTNDTFNTYYKGYARLSNAQFIGYGQFVDAPDEDKREGIHLYNLGDWNASRPTYIDSCSFDGGSYSAIGVWDTNSVPITNNVIYNTYESALVVSGQNNIVQKNLVSTVYWSGTAQPQYAEFNINNDGAITSMKATSVVMTDNLVSGVDRLAYRIQGNACPGTIVPGNITNNYDNNEAHSALSGVNIWPVDKGFDFDLNCVQIKGFKTYKTWFYGLYINNPRNIIIDSCAVADSAVGMFSFVIGPAAITHVAVANTIVIQNSLVIGAITPNDCNDVRDKTTVSAMYAATAIPDVAAPGSDGEPSARTGISFPYFSGNNMMPRHPYTCVSAYPCIEGLMIVNNVTFGFFNDVCSRQDAAIRVSQNNDDGQHPVTTSNIYYYNSSVANIIFNGRPNLDVVDPSDCVDMDCDGLKKALLTDTDGSLLGQPTTVFSQAEYLWGDQAHGVGDFRIPSVALADQNGQMININLTYPWRGIARAPSCVYQPMWQMYYCPNNTNYRMLIIESMDSDTETRRLSPVAIMPPGFIDLINGPQDHGWCNGYTCQKRISTFMSIIETGQHTDIYLTSTTPNQIRFRLLNADASVVATLGLYYSSLQQVDVYANGIYVAPTNRNTTVSYLMLLDEASNVTLSAAPGTNYFNRTTQMATFVIRGGTVIDLQISELIVLTFGLPAVTPAGFFGPSLLTNLAALLGVSVNSIRRVDIVSAGNDTRIRRQLSTYQLRVEIRSDPPQNLSAGNATAAQSIYDTNAAIINSYQSGELLTRWQALSASGGVVPFSLNVQEPLNQTTVPLSIISRVALITPPSSCRQQSACDVQPVLVAYDAAGNVIQKLGSNDQPWQVVAFVVGQPSVALMGAIANYSSGQTQYNTFGVTVLGTYQIAFRFIAPNGVSSTFIFNTSLTANSSSISIANAVLAAKQNGYIDVVSVNQAFSLSLYLVDQISQIKLGNIQWGGFTWSASVSLYGSLQYSSNGSLSHVSSSAIVVDTTAGTITASNLTINDTGMYIIQVQLQSSNNQYSISLTSNGILVKQSSTVLDVDTGFPTTYITFNADYDALKNSNQLEITRATIYNYLLKIKMPISSDLVLSKGSTIGSYSMTSGAASNTASAVNILTSSTGSGLNGLPVSSVTINGQTVSGKSSSSASGSSSSSSGSQSSSQSGNNNGLIIGLVLGLTAAAVCAVLAVVSYKKYQKKKQGRKLFNEPDIERAATAPIAPSESSSDLTSAVFVATQSAPKSEMSRLHSPLPTDIHEPRVPSATVSVSMMDQLNAHKRPKTAAAVPDVELIKFD